MFCPKCSAPNLEDAGYCRACGNAITPNDESSKLKGNAVAKFIVGDIFVLPAVLLVALESSVQSVLWILLAIPGVILYTLAAADLVKVYHAQRRRRELDARSNKELGMPARAEMPEAFSGRAPNSIVERTTRDLSV